MTYDKKKETAGAKDVAAQFFFCFLSFVLDEESVCFHSARFSVFHAVSSTSLTSGSNEREFLFNNKISSQDLLYSVHYTSLSTSSHQLCVCCFAGMQALGNAGITHQTVKKLKKQVLVKPEIVFQEQQHH